MSAGKTALIVGGNRGIGLNLVKALSARNWTMVASVRPQTVNDHDPSIKEVTMVAPGLQSELTADVPRSSLILELKSSRSMFSTRPLSPQPSELLGMIARWICSLIVQVPRHNPVKKLDVAKALYFLGIGPEPDNWFEHTGEILLEKFCVNSIGPFLTSKHFHPNLKLAKGKIINISSNAGSIGSMLVVLFSSYSIDADCWVVNKGEDLGYRMSKAALNQLTATLAKEFIMNKEDIAVVSIYPGYVPTKMTNFKSRDNMDECIEGIVGVVEGVGMEQTGTFVDWKGQRIPW
ncbi:hypothetical protein VTL71DRAFT_4864 [Oculimacula yallundae]|uniref:NAD(P)-binding protein n=1 Tax=Oculimacula yallundae TaxID=86028 RepID=A0ABR4C388_9HELO